MRCLMTPPPDSASMGSPMGRYFAPWDNPKMESGPDGESLPLRLGRDGKVSRCACVHSSTRGTNEAAAVSHDPLPGSMLHLLPMNVVQRADWKPLYIDTSPECIPESLDAIGREHKIQVERTVLELHEVLAADNLVCLVAGQREPEFAERSDHGPAVGGVLLDE